MFPETLHLRSHTPVTPRKKRRETRVRGRERGERGEVCERRNINRSDINGFVGIDMKRGKFGKKKRYIMMGGRARDNENRKGSGEEPERKIKIGERGEGCESGKMNRRVMTIKRGGRKVVEKRRKQKRKERYMKMGI